VECFFHDGKYEASMTFNGTSPPSLNTTVTSTSGLLYGQMANQPNCSPTTNSTSPCWITATNYRATAEAFTQLLVGQINYDDSGRMSVYGSPELAPLFNIYTTIGSDSFTWNFDLSVSDLSSALENMFGIVTLALISVQNQTTEAEVTFVGDAVWEYDAWLLWAIYAPTLFVFGLFAAHGLWCIKQDGAVDNTFMSFLVSTRNEDFDRAVSNAGDLDTVKGIAVTYGKNGVFEVVADSINKMVA